jgi:nucleoside-triphosphatase THEP1
MINPEIHILTAGINEGKTSLLHNWASKRNDVYGILTPKENGKRFFLDINTGDQFDMEAVSEEESTLEIGRFVFSKIAFDRAIQILRKAATEKEGWLIIDEVGPLEISQNGFHEFLKEILADKESSLKIILVVRKPLVDDVITIYGIDAAQVTIHGLDSDFFKT